MTTSPSPPPGDPRRDPKHDNVVYHDWEAATYDAKWSISFDDRCIGYARDRFEAVVQRNRS